MSIIGYNKLTDDFEKLEDNQEDVLSDKFVMTALDYILLLIGARDYDYLMYSNKNMLDNEVTSLYPIISYPMLQFLLFMLSLRNPYIHDIFKFRKDRVNGVGSEVFFKTINDIHKKYPLPKRFDYNNSNHSFFNKGFDFYFDDDEKNKVPITYNFSSRPLALLVLPSKFLLTDYSDLNYDKEEGDSKYIELYFKHTHMLTGQLYAPKLKIPYLVDLEFAFKNEVLEYMPRFYYNRYSQYYENLIKQGSSAVIKKYKNLSDEYGRYERTNFMSKTDFAKMSINIELNSKLLELYVANKRMLDKKLGVDCPKTDEQIKQDLFYKIKEQRFKKITNVDELAEFYIKSIILRRSPKAKLNTALNRTNGIYLLHNGVARFRELLEMEILRHRKHIEDNVVKITSRSVEVRYKKETTRLKLSNIVDLDNKPYLLSKKFMKLLDTLYGPYELHKLIKYSQIYTRLFNHLGNKVIWLLLGTELEYHTGFDYQRYVVRRTPGNERNKTTFVNFERLLDIQRRPQLDALFKSLREAGYYTALREKKVRKKFLFYDDDNS